ncbi:hypothetical protein ACFFX0_08515 [Citricoccus parietis]|uniref:Uncharacterized protein n=1 Tax=Citricoccus parietis TaxID=592307 RepID=A0ABV5FX40_9MICC
MRPRGAPGPGGTCRSSTPRVCRIEAVGAATSGRVEERRPAGPRPGGQADSSSSRSRGSTRNSGWKPVLSA